VPSAELQHRSGSEQVRDFLLRRYAEDRGAFDAYTDYMSGVALTAATAPVLLYAGGGSLLAFGGVQLGGLGAAQTAATAMSLGLGAHDIHRGVETGDEGLIVEGAVTAALAAVGPVAKGLGAGLGAASGRAGRFFYDARSFQAISREYWAVHGPAAGRSLHHWLIPQRATWVPLGVRNAGWNLLRLPAGPTSLTRGLGLNQWMGFAPRWGGSQAAAALIVENAIRVGIPGAIAGSAYGGYRIGEWLADE
jgi:hypothetical protein